MSKKRKVAHNGLKSWLQLVLIFQWTWLIVRTKKFWLKFHYFNSLQIFNFCSRQYANNIWAISEVLILILFFVFFAIWCLLLFMQSCGLMMMYKLPVSMGILSSEKNIYASCEKKRGKFPWHTLKFISKAWEMSIFSFFFLDWIWSFLSGFWH